MSRFLTAPSAQSRLLCGRTDGRTDVRTDILRPTSLGQLRGVDLKMKTRHAVEGSFGNEFPAICNHCVVMTA